MLATVALYGAYAVARLTIGEPAASLGLIAGFYFLPAWILRDHEDVQRRYQVGPDRTIPSFEWTAARRAAVACAVVFPPFCLGFWWFYAQVCAGDLGLLTPVLWAESLTPWSGALSGYLGELCAAHPGPMFPDGVRWPAAWSEYMGGGVVLTAVTAVFVTAIPEELFHRGYLMSALEDRWPAKYRVFGVPFGRAALLSSALFAVGHLVSFANVARLATFFPSLVFAWLWRRSGSLWVPALFHAASNMLMEVLLSSTFTR